MSWRGQAGWYALAGAGVLLVAGGLVRLRPGAARRGWPVRQRRYASAAVAAGAFALLLAFGPARPAAG